MSDESLVKEINYLTDLIQSHQSSGKRPNSRHFNVKNTKHKWIPKKHFPSHHNHSHNQFKSRQPHGKKSFTSRNRNLVYRPQNPQVHGNGSNNTKETSVVFIKQEEGTDQLRFSSPQLVPSNATLPGPSAASKKSAPSSAKQASSEKLSRDGPSVSQKVSEPVMGGGLKIEVKKEPVDDCVSAVLADGQRSTSGSSGTHSKRGKRRGRGRHGSGKQHKGKQFHQAQGKFPGRRQLKWQRKASSFVEEMNQPHPPQDVGRYGPSPYGISLQDTATSSWASHSLSPHFPPGGVLPSGPVFRPAHPHPSAGPSGALSPFSSPNTQPRSLSHAQFRNVTPHTSTPLKGPSPQATQSSATILRHNAVHLMPTPIPAIQPPFTMPSSGRSSTPLPSTARNKSHVCKGHNSSRKNKYKWKRRSSLGPTGSPSQTRPHPKVSHGKGSSKSSKYKWRRRSSSGTNTATPTTTHPKQLHGKGLSKNTRYKWRRRSGSGSTTNTSLTTPTSRPKMVPHHKGVARKNKYKLRANSLSQTKRIVEKALKIIYKKHCGNKVWIPPPQSQVSLGKKADQSDDDVVFVRAEPPGTVPTGQLGANILRKFPTPPRLLGYEKKTKRGNKQWIGAGVKPVKPVMRGPRLGVRSRNRKWVHPNVLSRENVQERIVRRSLTRWRPSSVVCIAGGRYSVDPTGKKLKRVSLSSSSFLSSSSGISTAVSGYLGTARSSFIKRKMASRVVKKSKAFVWRATMHRKLKKYCVFYNRFGKCNRGSECRYVHDPARIAVCPGFLKGTCDKADGKCLLSHEVVKGKMPTCAFFLQGGCGRDNCPYLHVSVGTDAKVCPDFLKGFCPRGEECTLQHRFDCPAFTNTGSCPEGSKCLLLHKKMKRARKKTPSLTDSSSVREPKAFRKVRKHLEAAARMREKGEESEREEGVVSKELDFMPLEMDIGELSERRYHGVCGDRGE